VQPTFFEMHPKIGNIEIALIMSDGDDGFSRLPQTLGKCSQALCTPVRPADLISPSSRKFWGRPSASGAVWRPEHDKRRKKALLLVAVPKLTHLPLLQNGMPPRRKKRFPSP
jgi:hypothetical protein